VPRKKSKDVIVVDDDSEPEEVPDSEEDDEEEEDKNEDGDYGAPFRRSTRVTKKPVKNLPFSPQKRRAKKGMPVRDSGDEGDGEGDGGNAADTNVAARRSSRTTKNAKASYKEDEYVYIEDDQEEEESGEDDDKPQKTGSKKKTKAKKTNKVVRGKASRPAYGNFRAVADLDYDAFSDDETVVLRAHRDVCEKCHRGPGHMLVQAVDKKSKGKGRKKQDEDEDADLEGTEMERLTALGGWVRWYVSYFEICFSHIDISP
jgi:chromodomain-helicase-DNA-binding protein 4